MEAHPMGKFRKRIFGFYILMTVLMLALTMRLFYIQVVWSEDLTRMARAQQDKNIVIPAERGGIYDRTGDKLAFSIKTYSIWAQKAEITKPIETARLISDTIDVDPDAIVNRLLSSQSTFVKIVSNISKSEADLVRAKGIKYISITEDTKRLYPYSTLAAHIIGNVNVDGDGFLGLELFYNNLLKGVPGLYNVTTDVYGRQLAYGTDSMESAVDGQSVWLTLDDTIQFFVEDRLQAAMAQHNPKSVSAIVMDPKTGEIIAMASKPDFDLNNPRAFGSDMDENTWRSMSEEEKLAYWNEMWKNKTISNTYEPGSTFKTFVSAIGLEEKLITLDSTSFCNGFKIVNGVKLHCVSYPVGHGHQTFVQAFVNSCNPTFIELGQKIGVDKMYEYFERFGLFDKTNVGLPAEAKSIVIPKEKVGPIELATLSYGHGINLTMMQVIRTMSAMVNGGYLLEPQIVKTILNSEGEIVQNFEPKIVDQVISTETSNTIRFLLEAAVKTGGGRRAYIEGIRVGGKSGTTQKMTETGYENKVVVVSFVGVAPIDDPQFVVLVVVDEPSTEYLGSLVAAPIVKGVLEDILRYKNIVPNVASKAEIEVPNLIGQTVESAMKRLDDLGLFYSTVPIGLEDLTLLVANQFPAPGTKVTTDSMVIISVED